MKIKPEMLEKEFSFNAFYQMIDCSLLPMFEYEGLPDSIPADILENVFNKKGMLIGFRYPEIKGLYESDLIVAPFTYGAKPDVYGYGQEIIATSRNGKVWHFDRIANAFDIAIINTDFKR